MAAVDVEILQIPVAGADNFSYLIICKQTGKALGVDPGMSPKSLLGVVADKDVTLEILVNTHGHHDHIAGNVDVIEETGAQLAASHIDVPQADINLEDGSCLQVGEVKVQVLHTPGHTPGHIVLNPPGALITGDTLFVTRCGRADFPGSDPEALYHSIQRLASFPPETKVFPGHDYGPQPQSTIGFEREHNEYMKCPDLKSFIKLRMG